MLVLAFERNTLISTVSFTPSVSVNTGIKISMGSRQIQSIHADDRCEHGLRIEMFISSLSN